MKPLVLAIPNYNGAKYLRATLESLNANGEWVRWWLQDGGSTDESVHIAKKMAREGDVIISEKDNGQADALNRVMPKMGGEIIGFINSDDCLKEGAARAVIEKFQSEPELDMVVGQVEWIDENGVVTGNHAGNINSLEKVLDLYHVWWRGRQWVQPEVFWRRSLFEKVGNFNTDYHLVFDYEYWVRCWRAGARVGYIERPLSQFRKHALQKSTASQRAADELRDVVGKHLADKTLNISSLKRLQISAALSYDLYQGKEGEKELFASALMKHPEWLLGEAARKRATEWFKHRMGA